MSDTIPLDVPKDAHVRALCQKLYDIRVGLGNLGLQAHILDEVSAKLKEQASIIERYRSDRHYILGHNDGWSAAMATGLAGDMDAEPTDLGD